MDASWLALLPFLIVIPVSMMTKQVLPGLTLGLIVGAYLVEPNVFGGIARTLEYIVEGITDKNNLKIILFLYVFSGLVGMIKFVGGIKGFVKAASERITSKKGALFLTWMSTLGTFAAPSFRIVTVAPIMKALLNKIEISKKELAFAIETTSAPLIALVPIATAFVGYMVSVVELSLDNQGVEGNAYTFFLQSIPFNFFSIVIILLGVYLSFFHRSKKTENQGKAKPEEVKEEKDWEDCHPVVAKDLPEKPWNLLVPLILVIGFTLFLTWWDGVQKGFGFFKAFIEADVLTAMVLGLVITFFIALVWFMLQKFPLKDLTAQFIEGGNELMSVILLLSVVWGLAAVTEDLGFSTFITGNVDWIPTLFIPPVIFLLGALISYFVGSSWGTWGILMPLGISLAIVSDASLPLVIGAVFASGTFGALASPLSNNTVMIAKILGMNVMQYARFKLIPSLLAAGIATAFYVAVTFVV